MSKPTAPNAPATHQPAPQAAPAAASTIPPATATSTQGAKKETTVFANATDAQKFADGKNGAPLPEGQEKRVSFKVYECKVTHQVDPKKPESKIEKVAFAVAQNPAYALNACSDQLGISVNSVGGDAILPPEEYLKRLTPEQLEAARKFLGGK